MRKLIFIRGISGSGKTTFANILVEAFKAQGLKAINCAADDYFYDDAGYYNFMPSMLTLAHDWCKDRVAGAMEDGVDVIIVSNTSTTEWESQPYFDLAKQHGYEVDSLIKEKLHEAGSVHDVPDKVLEKQRARLKSYVSKNI